MRVLLTGAAGMLGSSLVTAFGLRRPDVELIGVTRADVDLRDPVAVDRVLTDSRPDAVVHAAARVGGIAAKLANPTVYLLDNLRIDTTMVNAAVAHSVPRFLAIGSAAVYPETTPQPIPESALLTGPLEPANEGYGLAKIALQRLCADVSQEFGLTYRTAIPSNLYGPGDDFSATSGHLIPAALGKVLDAHNSGSPVVEVWGDGTAKREFTFSGDLAAFLVDSLERLDAWPDALNLGVGIDHSIAEYYEVAQELVGFGGALEFDASRPAGVPRRLLDSSAARELGWAPATDLRSGMATTLEALRTERMRGSRA